MKIILGLLFSAAAFSQPFVEYRLSFPNALHHEAEVVAAFHGVTQPLLEVLMSRSSPGRYALHEFAKNVYHFRASTGDGEELGVMRPDAYGWNVTTHGDTVVVHYTVFGDHADGTYAGIDETHAHLNLPAVLVWARGFEKAAARLRFDVPAGSGWQAATQLKPEPDGDWSAPNLEWLMDSPVELSVHSLVEWTVGPERFRMAVHSHGSAAEVEALAKKTQGVVLQAAGVFGELPKFDNGTYTFLLDYLPYVYGDGMEHRDSTSISGREEFKDAKEDALKTISHEFFHAWNVKRIRPRSLEPFDFEKANMSGELWFAEGFTSYYGPLLIHRAGFSSLNEFAQEISGGVNRVLNAPGHEVFSPVEMSEQAPFVDAARAVDATNFRNTFISYYTYGAALALGLDLSIREQFPGKCLDDWMRTMWLRHSDIQEPYTLTDLQQALAEATGSPDFAAQVFGKHIEGREPLDYARLLAPAGLELRKANAGKPWIGTLRGEASGDGVRLAELSLRGSPLYQAGVEQGDEIRQCDGKAIGKVEDLQNCVGKHSVGDTLALAYVGRGGPKQVNVRLTEDPAVEVVPYENAGKVVSEAIKAFRRAWLGSRALGMMESQTSVN